MSIRMKVALAVVVVFALAGSAVLWTTQSLYQAAIDTAAERTVSVAAETFASLEQQDIEKLSAVNDVLRSRDDLRALFVAGDRDGLYAASAPLFEQLKAGYGITHLYYEMPEPDSTIFLRVHGADKFGDLNTRDTYLSSVESKSYGAGKDLGKTAFALRVVHPWYGEGGELIGYLETGQEIDEFLNIMADQTGDHLAMVLVKDALDGDEWAVMRENRNEENNWDDNANLVVAHSTSEQVGSEDIAELDIAILPAEGAVFRQEEEDGEAFVVGAFPVTNTTGDVVGAVLVEHRIEELVVQLSAARTRTMVILGVVGLVLVLLIVLMLNTLVFHRLDQMIEQMKSASVRLAGGDFDIVVRQSGTNDEIGAFERFFAEFLSTVAATLKQLISK